LEGKKEPAKGQAQTLHMLEIIIKKDQHALQVTLVLK
jgi:hypothetical protein